MTKARVPLVVAALVAALLLAELIVQVLINWLLVVSQPGGLGDSSSLASIFAGLTPQVVALVFFAAGVYLSLRYIAPVRGDDGWKRTLVRGIVATVAGAVMIVVLGLIEALLGSSTVSQYPFGYALGLSLQSQSFVSRLPQAFDSGLWSLINWVVEVVLAVVLLRVWLGRQSQSEVTAPASAAEKSVAR